jgi:WD40 repeat protein
MDKIILWDALTLKRVWTLQGYHSPLGKIVFSPDGQSFTHTDATLKAHLRDVKTGKTKKVLATPAGDVRTMSLEFSQDGRTLRGVGVTGLVRTWNTTTGSLEQLGQENELADYQFVPASHGKRLISSDESTLRFWDAENGQLKATIEILDIASSKTGLSPQWIASTPQGFYQGSANVESFIRWRLGEELYPAEKFKTAYKRPDMVAKALSSGATLATK